MKKEIKEYKREAVCADLSDFNFLSNKNSFIEVTEWHNGEGFDITIDNYECQKFRLTHGELNALNKLIKKLRK